MMEVIFDFVVVAAVVYIVVVDDTVVDFVAKYRIKI
jgi:hypothetical protein